MRYAPLSAQTDYLFTGQRNEWTLAPGSYALYDYNARFYDPLIGRFISADSIVPGAANPQSLNRYAYTLNNPLKYTDPSGHEPDGFDAGASCDLVCVIEAFVNHCKGQQPCYERAVRISAALLETEGGVRELTNNEQIALGGFQSEVATFDVLGELGPKGPHGLTKAQSDGLMLAAVETGTQIFATGLSSILGTGKNNVTLYRAIEAKELAHLEANGDYGHSPSQGGKYFALTEKGVKNFARVDGRALTVTAVDVPKAMLSRGTPFYDVGGAGNSIHFEDAVLPDLYKVMSTPRIIR